MLKKSISVLLAVLMMVSVLTVGIVTAGATDYSGVTTDSGKLYFDANSTGWDMTDSKIAFYAFPLSDDVSTPYKGWGGRRLQGSDADKDGIWEFSPTNWKLEDGVQYKIIFAKADKTNAWVAQTYDLYFDTTCLGHIAYCNGTIYENPADSSKTALAAVFDGKDATEFGPVLQVSSIGNVVGTCPEQGKTPYDIFVDFISVVNSETGTTVLDNARKYVVTPGTKTEQKMIDDIGKDLGLSKDDVEKAFTENEVATVWTAADSTLPAGGETPTEAPTEAPTEPHIHTAGEPVRENEVPATCKAEGSYDEVVYCTECQEEISREHKTIDKLAHTPGQPVNENEVPATCKAEGSYDEVVYCTECQEELSREHKTIDKLAHTPGEPVRENEVTVTCLVDGSYDEVVYCTECGEEISRTHWDVAHPGHNIIHAVEIPATATEDGIRSHYECTSCGKYFSDATGTVEVDPADYIIKAEHKRGDANRDGVVDVLDATIIQRVLAEYEVENYDAIAADADLDGIVDMIDVTLIQRIDAQMTTFEAWDEAHKAA